VDEIQFFNVPGYGDILAYVKTAEILIGFLTDLFSGVPKLLKTEEAVARLRQSTLWQFQTLANNLQVWVRNGVPLSTSDPKLRAQLTGWIHGTIYDSGLGLRVTAQGYDEFSAIDTILWRVFASQYAYSGTALDKAVLNFQKVNNVLDHPKPPPPPPPKPPPPKPPPPPEPTPCDSGNPGQDEILDFCQATQTSLQHILAAIKALEQPGGGGEFDPCCTAVVNALGNITAQLATLTAFLVSGGLDGKPLDLEPIIVALQELANAAAQYPPLITAIKECICTSLGSIATSLGPDVAKVIQNIADAINNSHGDDLLPAAMVDEMVKNGSLPAPIAQFFSDRPASWSFSGLISGIGHFLAGQLNPELANQVIANIKAVQAGAATPYQPFHSLLDVILGPILIIGIWWGKTAVNISGDLMPVAQNVLTNIGLAIGDVIPGGLGSVPPGVGAPAVAALNFVKSAPAPGELITTDNYQAIVQDAMGRAGLMGMTAWAAAMVGGFLLGPWEKYWGEVAAMIATAAGFEEISARALGPFLDAIIRNRAYQDANQKWPTRVPPGSQGLALLARRKISQAQADQLQGYAGLDPDWRPAMYAGAYRPVQPRVIVNAFLDQPIDRATLVAMLEDAALSAANVQLMADAIIYKSIANVRNSYLSALVTGYGKGVISDQELNDALTQFNFSTEAKQYVTSHVLIIRREVLAAEAEKTVVPLVANGNITPDDGLQQLEAAGVQPWYAQLQITLATTRATIHAAKLEAAAERKLALQRQREAQRAAVAQFETGTIDAVALDAALLVAGVDPAIASLVVSVEEAKRAGRMRVVYNQVLAPLDAKILMEKVAAIEQQTKDQLITLDQARAQLAALNIDQPEIEALVARWAATLKKSPGAAVYLTP